MNPVQTFVKNYARQAPATAWLIGINLAVYVITAVQAGSLTDSVWGSSLGTRMVLWGPFVASQPLGPLRAVSAMFLHLDASHVLVNMVMLGLFGREIERYLGTWLYVALYFVAGLGGSAAVLLMDPATPTAGASGALYALMAVLVAVASRRKTDLRAPLVFVLINILYTLMSPGVSLWGHMGGLIAGAVLAWPVTSGKRGLQWASVALVGAVTTGLCIAAGVIPGLSPGVVYPQ